LERDAARIKTLFVVLDALDEYTESRRSIISELHKIPNMKLMITGRPHVQITLAGVGDYFGTLKIRARDSDIFKYVELHALKAQNLSSFLKLKPTLAETIARKIASNAQGMYYNADPSFGS